jgi:hypothetical protein
MVKFNYCIISGIILSAALLIFIFKNYILKYKDINGFGKNVAALIFFIFSLIAFLIQITEGFQGNQLLDSLNDGTNMSDNLRRNIIQQISICARQASTAIIISYILLIIGIILFEYTKKAKHAKAV